MELAVAYITLCHSISKVDIATWVTRKAHSQIMKMHAKIFYLYLSFQNLVMTKLNMSLQILANA